MSKELQPHRGFSLLGFGLFSVVACQLLGPVVWSLAKDDLEGMIEGRVDPRGKPLTQVALFCGVVATALLFLLLLTGIIVAILFVVFDIDHQGPLTK